jgi:hypothetical protein
MLSILAGQPDLGGVAGEGVSGRAGRSVCPGDERFTSAAATRTIWVFS